MGIALVLVLCFNYIVFGIVEAVLWSKKGTEAFTWNEHVIFVIQRLLLGVAVLMFSLVEFKEAALFLGASLFFFFFTHDGAIYLFRNLIDSKVYPKRWFDVSTSSSAKSKTISAAVRIILAVVGLALTVYLQLKLY